MCRGGEKGRDRIDPRCDEVKALARRYLLDSWKLINKVLVNIQLTQMCTRGLPFMRIRGRVKRALPAFSSPFSMFTETEKSLSSGGGMEDNLIPSECH